MLMKYAGNFDKYFNVNPFIFKIIFLECFKSLWNNYHSPENNWAPFALE